MKSAPPPAGRRAPRRRRVRGRRRPRPPWPPAPSPAPVRRPARPPDASGPGRTGRRRAPPSPPAVGQPRFQRGHRPVQAAQGCVQRRFGFAHTGSTSDSRQFGPCIDQGRPGGEANATRPDCVPRALRKRAGARKTRARPTPASRLQPRTDMPAHDAASSARHPADDGQCDPCPEHGRDREGRERPPRHADGHGRRGHRPVHGGPEVRRGRSAVARTATGSCCRLATARCCSTPCST